MKRYKTIYADPAWDYDMSRKRHKGKSPRSLASDYYDCMTMEELYSLRVSDVSENNSHLYLWVTNAFMHEGHHLMEEWGFQPKTIITWVKDRMGLGWYFRGQTEHIIFGIKGSLPVIKKNIPTFFNAKRSKHSRKPDKAYEIIESTSPKPYLELFARERSPLFPKRDGWDVWGNEVESDIQLQQKKEL